MKPKTTDPEKKGIIDTNTKSMEDIIANAILQTIQSNQQLLALPCAQKAKFENWLKFELAYRLKVLVPDTVVEYKIPNGNKFIDIKSGNSYIELKTTNTNVAIPLLSPQATKPITQNINDIISDVNNLRKFVIGDACSRYVATIFFPYNDSQGLHLKRLREHINSNPSANIIEIDTGINTVPVRIFVARV